MPRPKQIVPNVHLHITISADLRQKLDEAVWSEVEQRIPAGALQRFIEDRLREYFSQEKLDTSKYILGGGVVCGTPATIFTLQGLLSDYKEGVI